MQRRVQGSEVVLTVQEIVIEPEIPCERETETWKAAGNQALLMTSLGVAWESEER